MIKLAILGNGRAGKDESGIWLGTHTQLRYVGSTSMVVCPLIAAERGVTPAHAWVRRHQERKVWYEWANEYRRDDPAKLAKTCLERGDMVIGLRDKLELQACKDAKLFDLIVWVEREVPYDPTVTFTPNDCDVIMPNHGSLEDLFDRWRKLMHLARIPVARAPYKEIDVPEWAKLPALPVDAAELVTWDQSR